MGAIMGLTAIGLIYSPWGQQSGAHLNPAVTLTFWRLGKVATWDALFYVLAQFAGGALGVLAGPRAARRGLRRPAGAPTSQPCPGPPARPSRSSPRRRSPSA